MKLIRLVVLCAVLAVAGCVYIPADMAVPMDERIDQLQTDIQDAQEPCKTYLQQDLDMFLKLRGAGQQ